ncbi:MULTISPECIES: PrpF domain-containing protein [unclassified Arthrobacter]|uniref:PrpF domain-containing protein n=1 Tax=unclassified Arthrobacter TaxID=235627 RepID=UPI00159E9298|nr:MULTISPECIES: PrpF domain-containing protein [unclassified Arthrobacter]MCQ9164542.1 hypothetical protein [Arthrobacter sp. STN4]NVM98215.1 hypothetical protein [Arthrobacter sp. SDTb3-6]
MPHSISAVPATLVRGGTSKCWIFRESDLPQDTGEVERLLIRMFGSPDVRQIDGVGGASSTTSKAIVVDDRGMNVGAVKYRFAQVAIDRPAVEWDSNCGNCATGLGLYALHAGLVEPGEGTTRIPITNTITGLNLTCEVPTPGGLVPAYGDRRLDGQYYPGVPVDIIFEQGSWSTFGVEFPTGNPVDEITVGGATYRVTLIDAGAPAALFDAADFGVSGQEGAGQLQGLVELAPELRAAAAKLMSIPNDLTSIPKVGIVGSPPPGEEGVSARMISMGALHPAIGLTSAVAVAVAAGREGTVVNRYTVKSAETAAGTPMTIHMLKGATGFSLDASMPTQITFQRSARVISEGTVLVPGD